MASIDHIGIELTIVIGQAEMSLGRILTLSRGAIIPLGQEPSDPLQIFANGQSIGLGAVRLNGERISVELQDCDAGAMASN